MTKREFARYRTQIAILSIITFLTLIGAIIYIHLPKQGPDPRTVSVCRAEGAKNNRLYANTQYRDIDFVQSCIDNIYYANPYNRPGHD